MAKNNFTKGRQLRRLPENTMDKKTMMENLARESNGKGGFNGAWLYAENGEIVSKGVLGFRDPDNTRPIREDTIFQLASVSKNFTAAAVMLPDEKARRVGQSIAAASLPEV